MDFMQVVAVGSKNPVKEDATRLGFYSVWPKEIWKIETVSFLSVVSKQPMNDEETIRGALYRAKKSLEINSNAVFGVGLEGGAHKIGDEWFETGWSVIVGRDGGVGIASSIRMKIPKKIMQLIFDCKCGELGDAIDIAFSQNNAKQKQGFFGLMTDNKINRTHAYSDAVISALSHWIHPELFTE